MSRISRIDPYSAYSNTYGSHSGSGYSSNCCPQVVDPLTFAALVGFIGAAVYLLQTVIDMSALAGRRKKRSVVDVFLQGKKCIILMSQPQLKIVVSWLA